MEAIKQRMIALHPTIETMMSLVGTAGVAYGVIHRGEVVYTNGIGYRNIERQLPVDNDTVFEIASLSKAMVSAGIGMLVEDGLMAWDTPLKDVLPEWHVNDSIVRNGVTMVDCLSHRTGLQMTNFWLSTNNNILISQQNSMKLLNTLRTVLPFRNQFQYNNFGYEVAGHVIEKITGTTWDKMLHDRVFEPLKLERTGTHRGFVDDNVSKFYSASSKAVPMLIRDVKVGDNTVFGAAGGVRSTLKDLLKMAKAWLVAAQHQLKTDSTSTPGSPLKQVNHIMSSRIHTYSTSLHETSYSLGWARIQLPGPMGLMGLNVPWLPGFPGTSNGFPIVGEQSKSQLVMYHLGSLPGVLSAFILLPESQGAIVLLTNTMALVDVADFASQALLEAFLDVKEKNDYVKITRDTVAKALAWYPSMAKIFREDQDATFPRAKEAYLGTYTNEIGVFRIDIVLVDDHLQMRFQGLPDEAWNLYPWKGDTLTWFPESRDELARRGRYSSDSPEMYKIKFDFSGDETPQHLIWAHEAWNIPEGEKFFRS